MLEIRVPADITTSREWSVLGHLPRLPSGSRQLSHGVPSAYGAGLRPTHQDSRAHAPIPDFSTFPSLYSAHFSVNCSNSHWERGQWGRVSRSIQPLPKDSEKKKILLCAATPQSSPTADTNIPRDKAHQETCANTPFRQTLTSTWEWAQLNGMEFWWRLPEVLRQKAREEAIKKATLRCQ